MTLLPIGNRLRPPNDPKIAVRPTARRSAIFTPIENRRSTLLRRLSHEAAELWRHLRTLALRTRDLRPIVLRDGHGPLEGLLALLTEVLVPWHGSVPRFRSRLGLRAASDLRLPLLDDLIRPGQDRRRDDQVERLRR